MMISCIKSANKSRNAILIFLVQHQEKSFLVTIRHYDLFTRAMDLNELIKLTFTDPYAWISDAPVRDQTISCITISIGEVCPGDVLLLPATEIIPKVLKMAHKKAATMILIRAKEPQSEL